MEKQQIDAELRNLSGGAQALHGNPPQRRCVILEPVLLFLQNGKIEIFVSASLCQLFSKLNWFFQRLLLFNGLE